MPPLTLEEFAVVDLRSVVRRLTMKDKVLLLAGDGWWRTFSIPRVGVPAIKMSDGPNGVRGSSHFLPTKAQTLPSATALGATFDVEAIRAVGGVLAREAKAKGSSVLLAPTCNIQRSPLNGRAFESFSEDPLLNGYVAAAYIEGLQENGVGAAIKHFTGNDQEHERLLVDARIPERALREIYLKPFEIAERVSKPWSVMTSYSKVNGTHVSESTELLQGILRDEWEFDGLVMSDWFGTYSTDLAVNAGLDLEMPGPSRWRGERVEHLLAAGKIEPETIHERVFAILQLVQRSVKADIENVRNNTLPERPHDSQQDRDSCRSITADTVVLLKNSNQVLPLDKSVKNIAVIGPNAKTRTVSGGGSAYLTASYVVTPLEGIKAAVEGSGVEVVYAPGCYGHKYLPMLDGVICTTPSGSPGWTASFYNGRLEEGTSPLAVHVLLGTRLRINDEKPEGLAEFFSIRLEGFIEAEQSGPFNFGISLVGRAQVFVDDELVVDNGWTTKQTRGSSFYGLGTVEEVGTVDFVAGRTYKISVLYSNLPSEVDHDDGDEQEDEDEKQPSLMMAALRLGGAPRIEEDVAIAKAVQLAQEADTVILVIGTTMDWECEAADRESLALPGRTDDLVSQVLAVRPDTVIVNQSGSAVAFPWIEHATTVLQAWFGGNEAGNAIADVVFGRTNPSARMPLSFPHRIEDCTAHLNWGSESGRVTYGEGVFVGYRGYEETAKPPMFAFGDGLSFTSFDWSSLSASLSNTRPATAADLRLSVSITVRNIGSVVGREVVQIYILPPSTSSYRRPARELKGFFKTQLLAPGEEEVVTISLDKEAFSYWRDSNDSKRGWVAEKGVYSVAAQRSSRKEDVVQIKEVRLESTVYWRGL